MEEKIRAIFEEVCEDVNPDSTSLMDDGDLDSVTLLSLVSEITDTLGIDIPYKEVTAENFNSIKAIAALCEKYA